MANEIYRISKITDSDYAEIEKPLDKLNEKTIKKLK